MAESVPSTMERLARERGRFQSGDLVAATGLSRQALNRHLSRAVEEGWLVREGAGRGTRYVAAGEHAHFERRYPTSRLEEVKVVREVESWLRGHGPRLTEQAEAILDYVLSELVNNSVDHSGADEVGVRVEVESDALRLTINDAGIGAFENLRKRLHLDDHLHALQELSKGKVTTQPAEHSGEGLFFTSKMVTRFSLTANELTWLIDNTIDDQTIERADRAPGTRVELELSTQTHLEPGQVFHRYTHDFEFDTSRCVIRLFEYGTRFISRSEAKRLVQDLERFREVILDFHGVKRVGQGFVDQVFRVWARQHPEVKLVPEAMNDEVEFMVQRGIPREGGGGGDAT